MKIGFMSSSCPNFTLKEIVDTCTTLGFQGFEPRIEWGHAHGVEPGASENHLKEGRRLVEGAGLEIPCIASGIGVAVPDGSERAQVLDQVKRMVDLNQAMGAPYVRIFGKGAPDLDEKTRVALAIETLGKAADIVSGSGVELLLETHDFFSEGRLVGQVIDAVDRPEIGILWDSLHPIRQGEKIGDTIGYLKFARIKHTHFRDMELEPLGGGKYKTGEITNVYGGGDVPLKELNDVLVKNHFDGMVSLEAIYKTDDTSHDALAFLTKQAEGMRAIHQG